MCAIEKDFVLLVEVFFRLGPALPSFVTCGHRIRIRLKGQKREKSSKNSVAGRLGGGFHLYGFT
jgi:hypothetical protein